MVAWLIPALVAAASSVGSNALHNSAANKVAKEQRLREMMELSRQDEMRSRAQGSFADLLATHSKEAQLADQASEVDKLEKAYTGAVSPSRFMELLPGQGDSSKTVMSDIINEGTKGVTRATASGKARANLEGYGRSGINNAIRFNDTHQTLNNIADESRGSANILPLELNAAQNKGANKRGWANLLSTVGSIAGSVAAGSAFNSALGGGAGATQASTVGQVAGANAPLGAKFSTLLKGGNLYGSIPGMPNSWVQGVPL
jgi:hypothetical protein